MEKSSLDRAVIDIQKKLHLRHISTAKVPMPLLTRRQLIHSGLTLSVGSVAAGRTARALQLIAPSAEMSASALAPRERLLMDFDWKFLQGNGSDPYLDLGFGAGQGDFAKAGDFSFAKEKLDDAK